jgi:hypothetical protein
MRKGTGCEAPNLSAPNLGGIKQRRYTCAGPPGNGDTDCQKRSARNYRMLCEVSPAWDTRHGVFGSTFKT